MPKPPTPALLPPRQPRRDSYRAMGFDELGLDESLVEQGEFSRDSLSPGEYDLVDWERCRLADCRLSSTSWRKAHFTDIVFDGCDLANVVLGQSGLERVEVNGGRLTGLDVSGCTLQSVAFRESLADLSVWRFARLERVRFEGCRLTGSDWYSASLNHVTFDGCDLSEADFNHCEIDQVRFTSCTLAGIKGIEGLRGAAVDAPNLVELMPQMAISLGIRIADADADVDVAASD